MTEEVKQARILGAGSFGGAWQFLQSRKPLDQLPLIRNHDETGISAKVLYCRGLMIISMLTQVGAAWHHHDGLAELERR